MNATAASIDEGVMMEDSEEHRLELLSRSIEDLRLSVRARNALRNAGLVTIGKIVARTPEELLSFRGFGRTCLEEVEHLMASLGLQLGAGTDSGWATAEAPSLPVERPLTDAQRGWLSRPLTTLILSIRAQNSFAALGLKWIGDLVLLSSEDLATMKNLGRRTIADMQDELARRGLSLGLSIPEWSEATRDDWDRRFGGLAAETLRRETAAAIAEYGANDADLGSQLRALALWLMGERDGLMMIRFMGWDGKPPRTLEEVGQEFGLTRERVRQLAVRFERRVRQRSIAPGFLLSAHAALAHLVPCAVAVVEKRLRESGAGIAGLHLGGVLRAMELFGHGTPYSIHRTGDLAGFVCDSDSEELVRRTVQEARRSTSRRGCFRLAALVAAISDRVGRAVEIELVRRVIDGHPEVEWLDAAREWGWAPEVSRSRLFRVIRQVLAVAPRVDLAELRAAIRRDLRMDGFSPPRKVLEAIVRGLPWAEFDGVHVRARGEIADLVPDSNYAILRDALAEAGGVTDRYSLVDACCERGMNINSCQLLLTYCPIVVPLGSQVFALIGADVPPGTIERLRPKATVGRVLKDHGWTDDGWPWVAMVASRSVIVNGLLNMPQGLRGYVQGSFTVRTPGQSLGTLPFDDPVTDEGGDAGDDTEQVTEEHVNTSEIRVNGVMVSGLRSPLAELAAEVGDTIILVFDPASRTVRLEIGDEVLRSEFQ